MSDRRCHAITKAGKACKAHPVSGSDFCLAHDETAREIARFGGLQPGAGRPPAPRVVDVIRERIEEEMDEWYQVLLDARDASKPVMVGHGEDAYVVDIPDHGVRLAAFREVMDRAYGKPKQATELSGPGGGPIAVGAVDLSRLSDDELRQVVELTDRCRVDDHAA